MLTLSRWVRPAQRSSILDGTNGLNIDIDLGRRLVFPGSGPEDPMTIHRTVV